MPSKYPVKAVANDMAGQEENGHTRFSHKVEYDPREQCDSNVRDGIRNQSQPQERAHPGREQLCSLASKPLMKGPIPAEIIEEIRGRP